MILESSNLPQPSRCNLNPNPNPNPNPSPNPNPVLPRRVTDELKHRNKLIQLSFVDFLEALLRVACVKRMPTDEQMAKVSKSVGW